MGSKAHRVAVTGLGVVSPIGVGVEAFWAALVQGTNGIAPITAFDASAHAVRFAGEVRGFEPAAHGLDPREARRMGRFCQLGLVAALEAWAQAGFAHSPPDLERTGVVVGSGMGALSVIEEQVQVLHGKGPQRVSPFTVPWMIPNMAAGHISMALGAKGPNLAPVTACATGAHALGEAWLMIRAGMADVILAGGAEAVVTPLAMASFANMKALSTRNEAPDLASRPFDQARDGFVLGEGAGVLVLERLDHAEARGAKVLAELVGYGATADAHHMTAPPERGEGARAAMGMALRAAGLGPQQVDHVNAHATSTPLNDAAEAAALVDLLGARLDSVSVTGVKSCIGHLLGAAGGVESVATVLSLVHGLVPPTRNLERLDAACPLDVVRGAARPQALGLALKNNMGFGGHNAALAWAAADFLDG